MSSKMTIENSRPGNYKFEVLETGLGTTKKGYPQATLRLKATHFYAEVRLHLDHYGIEEPAWIDWADYDEEIITFCVLFKANVDNGEQLVPGENDLFWYNALKEALGWDGTSFDDFQTGGFNGNVIQAWIAEDTYEGKTKLEVKSISAEGAPVSRELRKVDDAKLKSMNSLIVGAKKSASKPGKPTAAAPAPPKGKPGKPSPSASASAPSTPAPEAPATPSPAPTPSAPTVEPSEESEAPSTNSKGLPKETDKDGAWGLLIGNKGANSDSDIGEAFVASMLEVAENNDDIGEDKFTGEHWALVRDNVIRDLALTVA